MIVKKANLAVSLYLAASVPFFVFVAVPVLRGQLDFQFYADSPTYHAAAEEMDIGLNLVQVSMNFLGPLLIIKLLGGSYFLIYLLNVGLFLLVYRIVVRCYPVDALRFVLALLIAPLTFTSLFSVNKEIVAVIATVLFAASYAANRPTWRWLAIGVSVLARWQMTIALLAAALALGSLNPLRRHRVLTLLCLVAAMSVLYPVNLRIFAGLDRIAQLGAIENREGSGLFTVFIQMQNQIGGYVLAFIPKALHLFVGMTRRWASVLDTSDVMNNTILWAQSAVQLLVLSLVVATRRLRLSSDAIYIGVIIAAVISLSPIFSTRYLLPVYVLLAIELAIRRVRPLAPPLTNPRVSPVEP